MKKITVILLVIAVVIVLGAASLLNSKIKDVATLGLDNGDSMSAEKSLEKSETNETDSNTSQYVEYTTEVFEQSSSTRRVLFFYASWCPTCRPADANFKENVSQFPDDLTVIRVNYNDTETSDEEKELARKYGVTYQHTFVQIDKEGNTVVKWNGGQTKELLTNIK